MIHSSDGCKITKRPKRKIEITAWTLAFTSNTLKKIATTQSGPWNPLATCSDEVAPP
jgi:hypothetical protein